MLPKIKKLEFRHAHIDDDVYMDMDIFLHPSGYDALPATRNMSIEDFEKMLLHEPSVVILGTGFRDKLKVDEAVFAETKKHGVELILLPTDKATKKYQELVRSGKKVVAKLHLNC